MLRKKHSEPAQPDSQQALLEFETPADQPGKKDPKQFFKKNWKKITAVVCVAAVAVVVLLPRKSAKPAQANTSYVETALERRDITNTFSASGTTTGGTTTYPVTIRIDDTGDLLPGMNATAEIDVAAAKQTAAASSQKDFRGGGGPGGGF